MHPSVTSGSLVCPSCSLRWNDPNRAGGGPGGDETTKRALRLNLAQRKARWHCQPRDRLGQLGLGPDWAKGGIPDTKPSMKSLPAHVAERTTQRRAVETASKQEIAAAKKARKRLGHAGDRAAGNQRHLERLAPEHRNKRGEPDPIGYTGYLPIARQR